MEFRDLTLDPSLPTWKRIQLAYPQEPNWEAVSEDDLASLVEDFANEQACAISAILQLSLRNEEWCRTLATWLLAQPEADQWLKAAARDAME